MASIYSGMAWAHLYKDNPDSEAAYQYILIAGQYIANTQQYGSQLNHAIDKAYILSELKRYEEALESINVASKLTSSQAVHLVINSTLDILMLKAEVYFAMEEFELAYQYQSEYLEYGLNNRERAFNNEAVEELRLKYESEQSDLQRKILLEKQSVQSLKLNEVKKEASNRQLFIIFGVLVIASLAWFLVQTFKGKSYSFNANKIDDLTKLTNRHKIILLGDKAVVCAKKNKEELSLLMFSIDNYKDISLQFSNEITGELLKLVAGFGKHSLKNNEELARFGENEFVVLFSHYCAKRSMEFSQQLKDLIAVYPWKEKDIKPIFISIGTAKLDNKSKQNFASLVENAKLSLKGINKNTLNNGEIR
jgi:diguanylate cyclase (GGDEF)-like protein